MLWFDCLASSSGDILETFVAISLVYQCIKSIYKNINFHIKQDVLILELYQQPRLLPRNIESSRTMLASTSGLIIRLKASCNCASCISCS